MADLNTNFPANASTENKSKVDSKGGMPVVDGKFDSRSCQTIPRAIL